jgi:hypothetical protein
VELFEEIRREYRFGVGTIQGVAKKLNTHRRMVRQALASAIPPERKRPDRSSPKLEPVRAFIDGILQSDWEAPRKQRHTAHRIWVRIQQEHRLLSIKLCLTGKSSGLLKTRLKHGIELRKNRGDGACNGSPSTILQR